MKETIVFQGKTYQIDKARFTETFGFFEILFNGKFSNDYDLTEIEINDQKLSLLDFQKILMVPYIMPKVEKLVNVDRRLAEILDFLDYHYRDLLEFIPDFGSRTEYYDYTNSVKKQKLAIHVPK